MHRYTVEDLHKDFPDESTCLKYLFRIKYGIKPNCPECKKNTQFYPIKKRKSFACQKCGYQLSPAANTIFHKSSTPLRTWFYAIFLISKSNQKITYHQLKNALGVTYKCAYRIGRKIKNLQKENPLFI